MPNFWHVSYKLILGKHFSIFILHWFSLRFRVITYAKNVKFTSCFLCCSFVKGETKEAFCFDKRTLLFLQCFLHTLFLENEQKTSEKKYREMFSYPFVAHLSKNKKSPKFDIDWLCPQPFIIIIIDAVCVVNKYASVKTYFGAVLVKNVYFSPIDFYQ